MVSVPSVNPPEEKWDRTFGRSDRDYGNLVQKTAFKNQKLFKIGNYANA